MGLGEAETRLISANQPPPSLSKLLGLDLHIDNMSSMVSCIFSIRIGKYISFCFATRDGFWSSDKAEM